MGAAIETGRTLLATGASSLRGTMLGPYRVVTELGEGGMGTVWYAEHVKIGRRVAIKMLHPDLCRDQASVARFLREARSVNAIRHPNIVDITDYGDIDGNAYLVMELLEGETLGARIERTKKIDLTVAKYITYEIALALGAAHAHGVVHRDLKPENIFLCARDNKRDAVKVLDFGIAKLGAKPGEAADGQTRPGLVLGTPLYMSPEQCVGDKRLDHHSDQYSLAVVVYEMLTGTPPFTGDSFGRLIVAHTSLEPAPLRSHDPTIPKVVDDVVLRALSKEPEKRFAHIKAFADAFEAAVVGKPASVPPDVAEKKGQERRQSVNVGTRLTKILRRHFAYGRSNLPGIPAVVTDCLSKLQDPKADLGAVAGSLERDPLITSRLMRIVNSPAYGGRGKITSVQQAIGRVGVKRTKSLLFELSIRQLFQSPDPEIRDAFRRLWEHCMAVGIVARGLAEHIPDIDPDSAYLVGLLHDVGKPVTAAYLLDAERSLLESLGESWMSESLWIRVVTRCHHEAGNALAKQWNLPKATALAITQQGHYDTSDPEAGYANVVRYADALVRLEGLDAGEIDYAEADATLQDGREIFGLSIDVEEKLAYELADKVHELAGGDAAPDADEASSRRSATTRASFQQ